MAAEAESIALSTTTNAASDTVATTVIAKNANPTREKKCDVQTVDGNTQIFFLQIKDEGEYDDDHEAHDDIIENIKVTNTIWQLVK